MDFSFYINDCQRYYESNLTILDVYCVRLIHVHHVTHPSDTCPFKMGSGDH